MFLFVLFITLCHGANNLWTEAYMTKLIESHACLSGPYAILLEQMFAPCRDVKIQRYAESRLFSMLGHLLQTKRPFCAALEESLVYVTQSLRYTSRQIASMEDGEVEWSAFAERLDEFRATFPMRCTELAKEYRNVTACMARIRKEAMLVLARTQV